MKKFFKSLIIATAIGSLNFAFADSLKVGVNPNFPPFEYIDDASKVAGFDIDLISELCKRNDISYEIIVMGFDGLIPALKSGKIDAAISGMSATEARKQAVDFTDAYYVTENLYLKKADNENLKSLEDLKDKKLGAQIGTVQEIRAREISDKVFVTEDPFGSVMALKNDKIDVFLIDTSVGYGYLKENPDLVEFFKESDGSDGFAIAFDKDKNSDIIEKFNKSLNDMKNDGSYDKLLEKYNLK